MLLLISDTRNMPILDGKCATFRWYFLTNDPSRNALTNILVFLCCYYLYVAKKMLEQTKVFCDTFFFV